MGEGTTGAADITGRLDDTCSIGVVGDGGEGDDNGGDRLVSPGVPTFFFKLNGFLYQGDAVPAEGEGVGLVSDRWNVVPSPAFLNSRMRGNMLGLLVSGSGGLDDTGASDVPSATGPRGANFALNSC